MAATIIPNDPKATYGPAQISYADLVELDRELGFKPNGESRASLVRQLCELNSELHDKYSRTVELVLRALHEWWITSPLDGTKRNALRDDLTTITSGDEGVADGGWRPMSTAPRDGGMILVAAKDDDNCYVARYDAEREVWRDAWSGEVVARVAIDVWHALPMTPKKIRGEREKREHEF